MKINNRDYANGLKALVIEDKESLSATALILVKTGARYEQDSNSGVAHFIEHTIFKGTKKRPESILIASEVENLGAQMNAFTSYEYTGYHIKAPIENFENSFEVLADMFLNSLFLDSEIEKERGVIIEEKNMYEDQPMDKVDEIFGNLQFEKHPLGREVIGHLESIKNLKREDFIEFMQQNYSSSNTLVVVAGGVDSENIFDLIGKNFAKMQSRKIVKPSVYSKSKHRINSVHLSRPINQSHIMMGTFAPSRNMDQKYAYKVGNAILGKGFGSKLFQKIRDELGLAYYVYSTYQEFEEIGVHKIGLGADNSKAHKAIEAVNEELRKIAKGEFSDDDLTRAKNYLLGNLSIGIETSDDMAMWFGIQELLLGKTLTIDQMKSKINKVKKAEIAEAFSSYLDYEDVLIASVTPHKSFEI